MYVTDTMEAIELNNREKAISFLRIVGEDFLTLSTYEKKQKNRHYTAKFSNCSKCLMKQ